MSVTGSSQTNSTSKPLSTFEFTKRKRWADILITGLTDVIAFILSPDGKVLYCGNAVGELLGWSETDLIDLHLNEYIHVEDKVKFQLDFEDAVRTHTELTTYVRFKCNTLRPNHSQTSDILFEIKGSPHFVTEEGPECKCFFVMAKPHPSRSTAMLNTFLEQKMENEKLRQRLATLKARVNSQVTPTDQTRPSVGTIYATSSLQNNTRYTNMYEDPSKTSSGAGYDGCLFGGDYSGDSTQTQAAPEESEDGSRKKKLKKSHGTEQYVCRKCGRTDSPEWRKGPDGPKTLCNACGLRWAKQMRRSDDPIDEAANYNQPLSSGTEG